MRVGFVLLMLAALGLALPEPAEAQIEGRTPKGIKYRFQFRPAITQVAVAYMFRDPSAATQGSFRLQSYGHPAILLGSGGDEREKVLRKMREAQVAMVTNTPFAGYVGGTIFLPADKVPAAIPTLAGVFQKPAYPEEELSDRHTKVVKGWREKYVRENLNHLQTAAIEILLPDYPLKHNYQLPSVADIKPPTTEQLASWHKTVFGRNNLLVAVAGNIREGDAAALIDQVFGGLPEVTLPAEPAEPQLQPKKATIRIERATTQVYVRAYLPVRRFNDDLEKTIALAIAVQAFGAGSKSILYKSIRNELGAAYGTSANLVTLTPSLGLVVVTLQLDPEKAPAAIARLKSDYDELLSKGVEIGHVKETTEELKKAELERTVVSRASNLLQYEARQLSVQRVREMIKLYDQISAERVNELIREILPKEMLTVVLGPESVKIAADCTIKDVKDIAKCKTIAAK